MVYENEYYVLLRNYKLDHFNQPVADEITNKQQYIWIELQGFARPFIFKEDPEREDLPPDPPQDVIFVAGGSVYPLVKNKVREAILDLGVPKGIALNSSVFIDYRQKWHEDYWLISVLEDMNYWDPENSIYDKESGIGPEDDQFYLRVSRVRLNTPLLDTIPLAERRIFVLSTVSSGLIIHESIKHLFESDATKLVLFADYFDSFVE